ncbi:aldo/keto reductase [Arenimonas sp. GDDSR-1]|uniref:aldo/keto reductase n=1 Tax=Arenimonas sp. GDDSR-1 TaxID=2950125 RepID=UPI002617E62B|nr:aldo/keto reductase [Arenimonas sp. GDDSR-1]
MTLSATEIDDRLMLGCWRLHERTPQQITVLLQSALESGIRQFDHADIYGGGESERRFAQSLRTLGCPRESIIIQSKCGIRDGHYDSSAGHILASVDGILDRLGTDYLDTLLLHRPDALMEPAEVAEAFSRLQAAGKVRRFGVSNFRPMQIELLQSALEQPLCVNQVQFGLAHTGPIDAALQANTGFDGGIDRDGSVIDFCRMNGLRVQAWSPLQFGMFAGNFLGHPDFAELNHALNTLAQIYGCSAGAIAIAWILRHPAGMQVLLGSTDPQRLKQLSAAATIRLPREHWYALYRSAGNRLP